MNNQIISPQLEHVREICEQKLSEIARCFTADCKITLIVRKPDNDEADFVLTNDQFSEAIKVLERRS